MTILCLLVLLVLATPVRAQTAADILGPPLPLTTRSSFGGTLLDDTSEVLTPLGIMNETMFDTFTAAIAPAAGPAPSSTGPATPTSPTTR